MADYGNVWDWVLELLQEGFFPNASFPGGELIGTFTFDGRSIGGRSQVFIGLKFPWLDDLGAVQSSDVIFPIGIFPGGDEMENTHRCLDAKPMQNRSMEA